MHPIDEVLNLKDRVRTLEKLVMILARGILLHEYAKDLDRYGTEKALCLLANDGALEKAAQLVDDLENPPED